LEAIAREAESRRLIEIVYKSAYCLGIRHYHDKLAISAEQ